MSAPVTRYEIRDSNGQLVAVHVRRDREDGGKDIVWERPDGANGLGGLPTAQLPLYGSEQVAGWGADEPIILVEGEKARDALTRCGFHALATVTGAASCPDLGPLGVLRGHEVILWPDADGPGRGHMCKLAERLRWIAKSMRIFEWSSAPEHGDAADYMTSGHDSTVRLRAELAGATAAEGWLAADEASANVTGLVSAAFEAMPGTPTRDDHVAALRRLKKVLSGLDRLDQTAARHEAAERLKSSGLGPREAQDLVRAALHDGDPVGSGRSLQGTALELGDPSPWPEPVEGVALAGEIATALHRYVVLPAEAAWAVVLWIFFTYLLEVVSVAPRLLMTSPTKACGKTRLLTILWALVRRALPGSSVTPPAVFRVIEAHAPTLLLDELDNLGLSEKPELLGVINSGHTRGTASVLRPVGEEHEVRSFSTWCAIAMAGIRSGSLPDTALSRAIKIQLSRKRKDDQVPRLREGKLYAEVEPLRRQLMRWSVDHAREIEKADPQLPNELDGRPADNWSVLISIADVLGGEWPVRARQAALNLEGTLAGSDGVGEMLLADLHDLFEERAVDRLSSEEMTAALGKLEGRPWAEWGRLRKPLSKNQLARLLKDFQIEPRSVRLADGGTAKGYYREWFSDAWARYLAPQLPSAPSQRHSPASMRSEPTLRTVTVPGRVTDQELAVAAPMTACDGVTVRESPLQGHVTLPSGPLQEFLDGLAPGAET